MMWAYLVHLGYNMWSDRREPGVGDGYYGAQPFLRCDNELWRDVHVKMKEVGIDTVVIDLGEGVKYESHPELAVKKSWSVDRLRKELDKIRKLGIEPIPKLNFSACHDAWLGPYSRRLSTPEYYQVCKDLIEEVIDLFDKPRFFHLGMDEELYSHQRYFDYVVVRQFDLWWHDFMFLVKQVEKKKVRPWIWSDYVWEHPELFYERMPKSIIQSNWYYGADFGKNVKAAQAYVDLEKRGYDQMPTGANWTCVENFWNTIEFCVKNVAPERLMGFFMTSWRPTVEACRPRHFQALDIVAECRKKLGA